MKREFLVIGLGRFGTAVAKTLKEYHHSVLAIDADATSVQVLANDLEHVIQMDATNFEALKEIGAEAFDTGIVCIGTDFESNLLTTVLLRRLGVRRIICKARTRTQREILLKVGADEVVLPEQEAGRWLALRLADLDLVNYLEVSSEFAVVEIKAPRRMVGRSLGDLRLRNRYGLTVMAIRRSEETIGPTGPETVIEDGDLLVVMGDPHMIERIRE